MRAAVFGQGTSNGLLKKPMVATDGQSRGRRPTFSWEAVLSEEEEAAAAAPLLAFATTEVVAVLVVLVVVVEEEEEEGCPSMCSSDSN